MTPTQYSTGELAEAVIISGHHKGEIITIPDARFRLAHKEEELLSIRDCGCQSRSRERGRSRKGSGNASPRTPPRSREVTWPRNWRGSRPKWSERS